MSRASLTITPSYPSGRAAGRAQRGSGSRSAVVDRGHDDVRGHHRCHPGADGRGEGRELAGYQGRRGGLDRGSSRWLSLAVSPWPGKCLGQAATPAAWRPVVHAATWRRRAGSGPKLRVPITGLSGLLLTSATGPRSRSMPTAERRTDHPPVARVRPRSSTAPSAPARATGCRQRVQSGDVATLLVDRDHGRGATSGGGGQRGDRHRAIVGVGAEQADAAEASATARPSPRAASYPGTPEQTASARRSRSTLIP